MSSDTESRGKLSDDGGEGDDPLQRPATTSPREKLKKRVSIKLARKRAKAATTSSSSESFTDDSSSSDSESEEDESNNTENRRLSLSGKRPRRSMDLDAMRARRGKSFDVRRSVRASLDIRRSEDGDDYMRRGASMDERRRYSSERSVFRRSFEGGRPYGREDYMFDEPENRSLFGIMPFMNLTHKRPDADSVLYQPPTKVQVDYDESMLTVANVLWTAMFGWMLALVYLIGGVLMYITIVGRPYGALCFRLASYYFWPFGKYLMRRSGKPAKVTSFQTMDTFESRGDDAAPRTTFSEDGTDSERTPLSMHLADDDMSGPTSQAPLAVYILWLPVAAFITLFHAFAMFVCWMIVFFIPMAKVNKMAIENLFYHPLEIRVSNVPSGNIVCCTYQAANLMYYQYSAFGLNVVLLNLFFFVGLTLIMGYALPHDLTPPDPIIFVSSILSIVPIAYYIGMAVASIANQTNFAIGAMLNAIFGVSIEIILYGSAILNGGLTELIQAGVIGSLLGDLLLMPGLSMIAGSFKYKEQRFSPAVAGVSSVLLLVSVIGVFAPTVYFVIAGGFNYSCDSCHFTNTTSAGGFQGFECTSCSYHDVNLDKDPMYLDRARPLMYACVALMPLSYMVGLLFTLKTHSHLFKNMEDAEHDAPTWSKKLSGTILFFSICLFALVSEKAVEALEPTLEEIGINQLFAGITVMALVPSSAEYVNAIGFALHNNVALSLEIGATSAVQISLIMTPVLVVFSAIVHGGAAADSFILVFHPFSFFAIIMAVLVVNYISIEGVANYFKGATMVICYLLFVTTFYFFSMDREAAKHH
eukprot:TRINITY_DN1415_c0_g1_i1.p1 TRINITY_DN1415_c0_g1~~TRINITY_DN1415_c0_g1_i1.p1  ORF type:complete len:814 (+),score=122.03 TRINITY_DN1415_c0_g1_i1:218-2659(+)